MEKIQLKNQLFLGAEGKEGVYDIEILDPRNKNIIVFMHGYMGFKDWGCWNLVQQFFVEKGFNFSKFNVSHNGTNQMNLTEFVDLESFGHNSYWKELIDLENFIHHLEQEYGTNKVHLIGHSRGGGMVLLGSNHSNVKSITTWAAISSVEKRMPAGEKLSDWISNGVYFVKNGRTNQEMPHFISNWNEFHEHKEQLNIAMACERLKKPLCIVHGTKDESVYLNESEEIHSLTGAEIHRIDGANHTFDSKHPWENIYLPENLQTVCQITKNFIETNSIV